MNAGMSLPPSVRDFEIYAAIVTRLEATRKVADDHELSQTRVRQIATRVSDWVAEQLPAKDEAAQAKEVRLLQHVAADRLEHQYGELIENWRAKNDPKFLRQATRIALAQARLGVMPGRIEALAADAIEGALEVEGLSLGRTEHGSVLRGGAVLCPWRSPGWGLLTKTTKHQRDAAGGGTARGCKCQWRQALSAGVTVSKLAAANAGRD